jgi:hypothetical protein
MEIDRKELDMRKNHLVQREEIQEMPAGRDIDALLAERVFGYRVDLNLVIFPDGDYSYLEPDLGGHWTPSRDILVAWEVVKVVHKKGFWFGCQVLPERSAAWFNNGVVAQVHPQAVAGPLELPLAISRAALFTTIVRL